MAHKASVIVLGGGIAGLSAAWRHRDQDVMVLEAAPRVGGWIQTIEKEGFLFELGPRSCRTYGNGAATLNLIQELGFSDEVLPASPDAQIRYLLYNQKPTKLPDGIFQWLGSPFFPVICKGLLRELFSGSIQSDCSIAEFVRKKFGSKFLDLFLNPLVSGIYAGDPESLSFESCFPTLFELQKEHRSLIKGMIINGLKANGPKIPFPLFTLKRGLNSLVDRVAEQLGSEKVKLNARIRSVEKDGTGWKVRLEGGDIYSSERIISTLPATAVETLWGFKAPPMASVAVVNLGYRQLNLPHNGFGYLIPAKENEKVLGVVWDSKVFPGQQADGEVRLTVMIGGTTAPSGWKEWDFKAIALDAIKRHMHIDVQPDVVHVTVCEKAIPQYEVGFAERKAIFLREAEKQYSGIEFRGALFSGVAINDCIPK